MVEPVAKSTWVEVHSVALTPGKRAPRLPVDTRLVPLETRIKGFLIKPACIGDEAGIVTPVGRYLSGTLVAVNPAYSHSFGPPIPELSCIGGEVRTILRERGRLK